MSTWQAEKAHQQQEKKAAEAALQQKLEQTSLKRQEEKKKRGSEHMQEEEQWKQAEAEKCKAKEAVVAEATVVSSTTQMEFNKEEPSINAHLADEKQGGVDDEVGGDEKEQHLPIKSKQKTTFAEVTSSKPATKPKAKSAKTNIDTHTHRHLRVIVQASIKLSGATPVEEFIYCKSS